MSILKNFPSPHARGHVTVCEIHGQLLSNASNEPQNLRNYADKVSRYPEVLISREMLRPSMSKQSVKTAFLQTAEMSTRKRALIAWNEEGFSRVLEELVEGKDSRSLVTFIARSIMSIMRWTNCIWGSFCPHLLMQNDDLVNEFSLAADWNNGYVRSIAWHPHTTKFAVAICDDSVRVYSADSPICPILKFWKQRGVSDLAWRPYSSSTLAVACFSCVIVWRIDPSSVATRISSSCAQVLFCKGHGPVTCLQWSPCGRLLLTSSPKDISMMVWDIEKEICEPLKRVEGHGVSLIRWSPDGKRIFSATPAPTFRVWDTFKWNCDSWSTLAGRCQAACWSPDGTVLLFAVKGESVIYSLTFNKQLGDGCDYVGGSKDALPVADLSEIILNEGSEITSVGGLVHAMEWDPTGERLAVTFYCKGCTDRTQELIALFRTSAKRTIEITPCGFIRGRPEEYPLVIAFQKRFDGGALLTVCWSSGVTAHIPLLFATTGEDITYMSSHQTTGALLSRSLHSSPFRLGNQLSE